MTNEQALRLASRTARQLRTARAVKVAILIAAAGAVLQAWGRLLPGIGPEANTVIIMAAVVAWVILSAVGAVGGRLINAAAGYSGAGRIDLADGAEPVPVAMATSPQANRRDVLLGGEGSDRRPRTNIKKPVHLCKCWRPVAMPADRGPP